MNIMAAERELIDDKISRNLELSAFLEEQDTRCQYTTNSTNSGFDLPDFVPLDFSPPIETRIEHLSHVEYPKNCEKRIKRKREIEEETTYLGMQPQIFATENATAIGNDETDKINEILDELLSSLGEEETSNESLKPKKPKITVNSEEFATPKVHICNYCPVKFYSKMAWHQHLVCHTKKFLRCCYCNRRSRSYSQLERHMEYIHGIQRTTRSVL